MKLKHKLGLAMIGSGLAGFKSLALLNQMFIPLWYHMLLCFVCLAIGCSITILHMKLISDSSYSFKKHNMKYKLMSKLGLTIVVSVAFALLSSGFVMFLGYNLNQIKVSEERRTVSLPVVEVWRDRAGRNSDKIIAGVTVMHHGVEKDINLNGILWDEFNQDAQLINVELSSGFMGFDIIERMDYSTITKKGKVNY